MELESRTLVFLRRTRYPILLLMLVASLTNAVLRFAGDSKSLESIVAASMVWPGGLQLPARRHGLYWPGWAGVRPTGPCRRRRRWVALLKKPSTVTPARYL